MHLRIYLEVHLKCSALRDPNKDAQEGLFEVSLKGKLEVALKLHLLMHFSVHFSVHNSAEND